METERASFRTTPTMPVPEDAWNRYIPPWMPELGLLNNCRGTAFCGGDMLRFEPKWACGTYIVNPPERKRFYELFPENKVYFYYRTSRRDDYRPLPKRFINGDRLAVIDSDGEPWIFLVKMAASTVQIIQWGGS